MEMVKNAIGRFVPTDVPGLGTFRPFEGAFAHAGIRAAHCRFEADTVPYGKSKITADIRTAIINSGLKDGMTISFHHHLRNGDMVLEMVLKEIESLGIRNLTLAPSSLSDSHEFVADYVRNGVVSRIYTSGIRGRIGNLVSRGEMEIPIIVRSHGGRARAIEEGSISIDVAFLAASACDEKGNMTGSFGPSAFGSIGYGMQDAKSARHVVAITDNLLPFPLVPKISIHQHLVHQVVVVDSIGDPDKLATGAVRITRSPQQLEIAKNAYELIKAVGAIRPGFSYQAGAGGVSIAVTQYIRQHMAEKGIQGSFALGGITSDVVKLLEEGLFKAAYDVQSFDPKMGESMLRNPTHYEIDPSCYANPINCGCMTHELDVCVLGALDLDVDFNVNVLTGHDGYLRGASGGHCDASAGAKLAIMVAPSFRNGVSSIKKQVQTVVTPGESVDAIVTERGISINPRRQDILEMALKAGLPVKDIEDLRKEIVSLTGEAEPIDFDESKPVALVEYRDGTLIDTVYKVRG